MGKRLLVIGDTIIDEYVNLKAIGLSLESPTIKTEITDQNIIFGGAANVAKFAHRFGMNVDFMTCMSKDSEKLFLSRFDLNLINVNHSIENKKTRFYVHHGDETYKHLQINTINKSPININWNFSAYDIVAFSDYRCGLIQPPVIKKAINSKCQTFGASQLSDKKSNLDWYLQTDYIVCNKQESEHIERKENVVITKGRQGCELNSSHYESREVTNVKNTIGAGDCFYAAFLAYGDPQESNNAAATYVEGGYGF